MPDDLLSLRDVHRRFPGVRLHQIKYALDSYRIEAVRRVGLIRLFSADQLPAIRSALSRTTGQRVEMVEPKADSGGRMLRD